MTKKPEELMQVIVTVMEVYREGTPGRMGDNSCKPGKIVLL